MKADIKIIDDNSFVEPEPTRRGRGRMWRNRVTGQRGNSNYSVDVKNGRFEFNIRGTDAKITIQDEDIQGKHILVNVQRTVENTRTNGKNNVVIDKTIINDKWLCGHDERDWFVAAVKGTSIIEAKQSLKPDEVIEAEKNLKPKQKQKRKNKVRYRQGEWFFVPVDDNVFPKDGIIHKDEPISRPGGGKPHIVEEVYRAGGRVVYSDGNNVVSPVEYERLDPGIKPLYRQRTADASVYGRGYVKHPDHETIQLVGWHRILMNKEERSGTGFSMTFLD